MDPRASGDKPFTFLKKILQNTKIVKSVPATNGDPKNPHIVQHTDAKDSSKIKITLSQTSKNRSNLEKTKNRKDSRKSTYTVATRKNIH